MKRAKHITFCFLTLLLFTCAKDTNTWKNLIDKDLSQWDIWLGIPHKSSGIKGYENVENVRGGYPPLGLGNKKNIFSIIEEDGEQLLKITGEIFGALVSKEEFENYHLSFQVKWGDKKWAPRLKATRNNGLLYHSIGDFGAGLWNTWMTSLEFEVEETNFGDFITINDKNVRAQCPATKRESGKYHFDKNAPLKRFSWAESVGRCFKSEDFEKPFGEWNTVELITFKNTSIHIVNGYLVNVVYNPEFFNGTEWVPMNKGKLQFQSEAAETYFKDVKIKSITKIDDLYKKYLK
ncbi:MAG: 3-keto-disaccharide hydrolase [Jejuia sp.]